MVLFLHSKVVSKVFRLRKAASGAVASGKKGNVIMSEAAVIRSERQSQGSDHLWKAFVPSLFEVFSKLVVN